MKTGKTFYGLALGVGGLFRLDRDKGISKQYDFSNGNQRTYYNSIFLIHEDTEGTLWVAHT